jgi:hypothetical protein
MEGENPDIQVLFNGVVVDTGAFVDPADSFTNTMPAPAAATSVIVTAFAAGVWGDKYPAGETSNAITVDLSTLNCAPTGTGRFTGGGQQVIMDPPGPGPVELAKGFEVDCDMNPMHENLELNWQGNHFHMDQITSAVCTLVPPPPNPPTAPVNRIDGTGLGSYNNVEGYTVVFTLIDHGEPGAKAGDASGFKVCRTDPANPKMCAIPANIVLDVPLEIIENGNIQAHVDQH